MVKAKHTAAHTHCFDETDMSAIVALTAQDFGTKTGNIITGGK